MTTAPSIQNRFRAIGTRISPMLCGMLFAAGIAGAQTNALHPATERMTAAPRISALIRGSVLAVTYVVPPGYHMLLQPKFLSVEVQSVPGMQIGPTDYPPSPSKGSDGTPEYSGTVVLTRTLRATRHIPAGTVLQVTAGWQLCAETGTCLLPGSVIREVPMPAQAPVQKQRHLPYYLLLAFLGGIVLNLMPCVLPVLSIKLLHIATSEHRTSGALRRSAWAYTAGILVSFAVLAVIVIVLRSGGAAVGWGFQFQNPGFVMGLLVTIWLFALSLFDLFLIRAPGMQLANEVSARQGLTGAFLSGVFAVLLATPCTAPLLGAAMGFAFVQPASTVILLFLFVGLGLAAPFLLVAFLPRAASWIPKPGAWMNTFREVMGFLLLATAIWLVSVLYHQLGDRIQGVLWYLLAISVAAWIYGRFANASQPLRKQWGFACFAVVVAVGCWFALVDLRPTPPHDVNSTVANRNTGSEPFSPERVAALRAEGRPVFIDFSAEWCLTCKVNERGVLGTDVIQTAFRQHNVALLRGDFTQADPAISEWLKRFHRAGVPLYLFYAPGSADPVILPELITRQMVLNLLLSNK